MPQSPYPDHIGVSEITTRSGEMMRVEAFFEGQPSLMFDEPEGFDIGDGATDPTALKGRSRGWTPVHAQLAALAGCTSITIAVVARDQGFAYSGLTTRLQSLIDIRGFFFDLHLQPKYELLTFDLRLQTEHASERLSALALETDRRCPQLGLFRLAKVPMLTRWFLNDAETPALEQRAFFDAGDPAERLAGHKSDG
jgi:uncharacterized OsmC-like protein